MFIDAKLYDYDHDYSFITDDKKIRDSFYEECLDIVEQNYKPSYNLKKEPDLDCNGARKKAREFYERNIIVSETAFWYDLNFHDNHNSYYELNINFLPHYSIKRLVNLGTI